LAKKKRLKKEGTRPSFPRFSLLNIFKRENRDKKAKLSGLFFSEAKKRPRQKKDKKEITKKRLKKEKNRKEKRSTKSESLSKYFRFR